jgi:hypothetical protein
MLAVSETTTWGWGSSKTLGLLAVGLLVCTGWVATEIRCAEPLIDMTTTRMGGIWTLNAAVLLLGAGSAQRSSSRRFAQLPKSTGFSFRASLIVSSLYLLPLTVKMMLVSLQAGRLSARFGSRSSLIAGSADHRAVAFALLIVARAHPYHLLISTALVGIGIGLSFSALRTLVIAAPYHPIRRVSPPG